MNESTTVSRASKRRLSIISADEPDFEVQRVDGFDCILLGPHPHLYFTEFVFQDIQNVSFLSKHTSLHSIRDRLTRHDSQLRDMCKQKRKKQDQPVILTWSSKKHHHQLLGVKKEKNALYEAVYRSEDELDLEIHLGEFESQREAGRCYDLAALQYEGPECAATNFAYSQKELRELMEQGDGGLLARLN